MNARPIGVFAAVTVATAAVLPGTPAAAVARACPEGRVKTLSVEHPTGEFSVRIEVEALMMRRLSPAPACCAPPAKLFDGTAFARRRRCCPRQGRRMTEIMSQEQKTALVVTAHPGDFVWRAGGAIALHAAKGFAW